MKKLLLFVSFLGLTFSNAQTNVYNYGFDVAFNVDWTMTNQSSPATATLWSKAAYTTASTAIFGSTPPALPKGQDGTSNTFAIVNYTSTSGAGTISNWLITPAVNVQDGDIVSFYTRKGTDGATDYADRLEMRYSTAATTVVPSGGSSGLGSFTNLGVTVNPDLLGGFVYPKTWTKYSFTVTGVGTTAIPVKFAFRYFVTSGGPSGNNSDIIGVDTFSVDRPAMAVSESSNVKLSVYPNPTKDFLNFSEKVKSVQIFDASGRKANSLQVVDNKVDVRNLAKGIYIIKFETEKGAQSQKFIKE
ncbi:T9SS type A sorting domain-containing protein [Kaistella flava (ex Peng et al. 2021)]|uniref:T9SS type A sorting domain-containing protein n=1 Tax=Kaistella flava (ex Peng et al. 2021) TaxID=2038776 RepID=A0A7M2Y8G6_9FLAO|nr:choice-of-anchor J domain-containing protein [Kaistella flava (ex Peng et al. 2021)]QOW09682.1 T9SS type A sorting domain-containing protein [Kaistella flava (ex Peng et al. 2021)]